MQTLPRRHRERYGREFTAELYAVPRENQLGYAAAVLSRAWALRAALDQTDHTTTKESEMAERPATPLLCRLHLRHQWRRFQTEEGDRYTACVKCGKEHRPVGGGENTIGA